MYSLEMIKKNNKEAARVAEGKEPYVAKSDNDRVVVNGCPDFGDYRPKGWKLIETYFVDYSGFGCDDEAALTVKQFLQKVKSGFGYAIIETGQFQLYVGEFQKTKRKK